MYNHAVGTTAFQIVERQIELVIRYMDMLGVIIVL